MMTAVSTSRSTILAIDDDPLALEIIREALEEPGRQVVTTTDSSRALELAAPLSPALVMTDLRMPGVDGMSLLREFVRRMPGTPVVIFTGVGNVAHAVEAMRNGAADFIEKPLTVDGLRERTGQVLRNHDNHTDRDVAEPRSMVGTSACMRSLYSEIDRIAPYFRTALITGPTGVGKELVARELQRKSPVARGPFVVVNSATLVETLAEAELFGHVRGAFTGAVHDRIGWFEAAAGGTLFLDEIGELPLTMQAKLLRILEDCEVHRVGSSATRRVDLRIIAATNRDLPRSVQDGVFRQDLYYRLATVTLRVPPLQDRLQDIPHLVDHFLRQFTSRYGKKVERVSRACSLALSNYSWPGNVRELENVLSAGCMRAKGPVIEIFDLPHFRDLRLHSQELLPLDDVCARHVKRVLAMVGGNKVKAAELLGVSRGTLYKMLRKSAEVQMF